MSPRRLLRALRSVALHPRQSWRLAALLGRPLRRFHPQLQRVVRIPGGSHPFSDEAIWYLSGRRTEFAVPPLERRTARGLCPAVEVVASYEDDLAELQRRLEALQVFTHRLAQLAAPASATPAASPAAASPAAQRRREGLRMLQPGDKPKVGSILIAHPMSCIFQPDLDRAVLVIDEVHPKGHVRGLVLNKPGGILMDILKPEELERAKEAGLSGLLHNRLYLGGDLMDAEDLVNHLRWLHSSDLPGAQRLAPGLYCGEGLVQLSAARPVLGFAGWHQDQLDLELERGVWVHLQAHSAVGLLPNDGDAERLWNDLAEAVGLSSFSTFPRGPEVDQLIKEHLEAHSRWQIESILEQVREENQAREEN